MKIITLFIIITLCLTAVAADFGNGSQTPPTISVASTGKITAKPDLAVVFLSVRSSAPLAADALQQNTKKVDEVRQKLAAMGYKDQAVRFTGNRFSPAGQGMYYGGGQRPTGFDVYNSLYVFIEGSDLKDVTQLNAKAGTLMDEMSKVGASPINTPISPMSMGGASVLAFTIKDSTAAEREAYLQALEKARPIADDIARRLKVQITGIESVSMNPQNRAMYVGGPASPLDELPYEFYSSSLDEVPVRVSLNVRYAFR